MTDRLDDLSVFVQAAEAGGFSAAAGRLHLTRSAVGKTVARLEARLGVRLFNRTTRSLSLTAQGQIYYEHCSRALAELDLAATEIDSGLKEVRGRLRVSLSALFGRYCAAPILLSLARDHPKLELDLSFSDRVVELVEERFDLAIRIGPLADSAELAARRLGSQRMGLGAAPSYVEKFGRPQDLASLSKHAAVLYVRAGQDVPWGLSDGSGEAWAPKVKVRARLDDLQAVADAAVAGAGLAWLPCWLLSRYVRSGDLVRVAEGLNVQAHEIHAVWVRSRVMSLKLRAAIDALAAELPKHLV